MNSRAKTIQSRENRVKAQALRYCVPACMGCLRKTKISLCDKNKINTEKSDGRRDQKGNGANCEAP